jgi:hypothetical protein
MKFFWKIVISFFIVELVLLIIYIYLQPQCVPFAPSMSYPVYLSKGQIIISKIMLGVAIPTWLFIAWKKFTGWK